MTTRKKPTAKTPVPDVETLHKIIDNMSFPQLLNARKYINDTIKEKAIQQVEAMEAEIERNDERTLECRNEIALMQEYIND